MDHTEGRSPGSTINGSEFDDRTPAAAHGNIAKSTSAPHQEVYYRGGGHPDDSIMTEDDDQRAPQSGPAPKPKGKGRGKAAFPKGGENTPASAYTGHKIRHLKKDDGEPLWRKDIQFDFLSAIFNNKVEVFTNSYEPARPKQSFADLYIDTMARSSKTSKILRDKLLSEHEPANNMAMVCLLVNLGRMNTTLNFFPEMRAQLRTYHAIPSLQAQQDPNSYKQLQDAPRLKSILKGASEDRLEPNTIEKIKQLSIPRTNPVNLVFVLAQYASRVTELHFPQGRDFYDLIMRPNLSSEGRANAFLWLMWHYLESDFTEEGCDENPFGRGIDYGTGVSNQGVPTIKLLSDEEMEAENVDTQDEVDYGEAKMRERRIIIEADQAVLQRDFGPPKRGPKPKLTFDGLKEDGASPASILKNTLYEVTEGEATPRSTPPRGFLPPGHRHKMGSVRVPAHVKYRIEDQLASSPGGCPTPQPPAPIPGVTGVWEHPARRQRPLTTHQLAVEKSRNEHVNHILNHGLRKEFRLASRVRRTEGAVLRAVNRTAKIEGMCEDSEGEESMYIGGDGIRWGGSRPFGPFRERGMGGLVQLKAEKDDYGEEFRAYGSALRRLGRRLDRWEDEVKGAPRRDGKKHRRAAREAAAQEEQRQDDERAQDSQGWRGHSLRSSPVRDSPGPAPRQQASHSNHRVPHVAEETIDDDLDDVDKTLLGLGGGEEDEEQEREEDLDDVDKALLGIGSESPPGPGIDGGLMNADDAVMDY